MLRTPAGMLLPAAAFTGAEFLAWTALAGLCVVEAVAPAAVVLEVVAAMRGVTPVVPLAVVSDPPASTVPICCAVPE